MTMGRRFLTCGLLAMGWTGGCADPCLDDGLSQEQHGNCPADTDSNSGTGDSDDTADSGTGQVPGNCNDGVQNGDETDVDCGGSCAEKCGGGEGCGSDDDCQSNDCGEGGVCEDPNGGGDCNNGVMDGQETDVDCGGPVCDPCPDGDDCIENSDCISQICDETDTCVPPSCDDGVQNGDETDVDCGGICGSTCEPGEGCLVGLDCVTFGCDEGTGTCNDHLAVEAMPACSEAGAMPAMLTSMASGGTGFYAYDWLPDDGTLSTPNMATTEASPMGVQEYTIMVDDGANMATDSVTVVNSAPLDLENNCNLYGANFQGYPPPSVSYDMGGTRACELGNNDFGLHLCEGVPFENLRLRGTLEVTNDIGDNDMMGLVWGAQDSSNFYSLTWKAGPQNTFGCDIPAGIVVKRVEAPTLGDLVGEDVYCPADTANSTLLFDVADTTTDGWVEGESYTVTVDFTAMGSDVTVQRDSDGMDIASFTVSDTTFTSGFFGSTTYSQTNACVGPLFVECL